MNSARLAKMQCPNCDSVGTIEIDDYEAQMFCSECCIVLAMNLGESDQTRYDGDERNVVLRERKADLDDMAADDGGGGAGAGAASASASSGPSKGMLGGGKKNDAVFDFIQCLQRRTSLPDAVPFGAVALYGQYVDKLKARTGKANIGGDGGQNAVAAAVFAITAARRERTVPLADLAKICRELAGAGGGANTGTLATSDAQWAKNILIKRNDVARALGIEDEVRNLDSLEFDHLSRQFHMALGWPLSKSAAAAAAFAKSMGRELSTASNDAAITKVEAVAVGLYMTRASKKLSSLVMPQAAAPPTAGGAAAAPAGPSTSQVLQSVCAETRVDVQRMTALLRLLQGNKPSFDALLASAVAAVVGGNGNAANVVGEKRPREDESSAAAAPSAAGSGMRHEGDVRVVRQ